MNAPPSPCHLVTEEEYLAEERLRDVRHEYLAGFVHPVPDANVRHCRIKGNLVGSLFVHLCGEVCEAFSTTMRLRIRDGADTLYYYPDALVCCDLSDDADYHRERPMLIMEIFSPETARVDQWEKLLAYRTIPSLGMYVLVDQEECRVLVHRREEEWRAEFLTDPAASLTVPGLRWSVSLREIYERTGLAE